MKTIGVINLGQINAIKKALLKNTKAHFTPLNEPCEISLVDAVVVPRGQSLLFSKKIVNKKWTNFFKKILSSKKPILAICGGMMVFAKELGEECEGRKTNKILDVRIDNNKINGVFNDWSFTDAPVIKILSSNVKVIFTLKKDIVAVRQNSLFAFTFFDPSGKAYKPFLQGI